MTLVNRRALAQRGRSLRASALAMQVRLQHAVGAGPAPIRLALVSDGVNYTSEQQFAPLLRNAAALRKALGLVAWQIPLSQAMAMPQRRLHWFDVIGLKLSFQMPTEVAMRTVRHFREATAQTATRLIYFDGDDDVCVQWPEMLSNVDCCVKKHLFADHANYLRTYVGKSNLTDYVHRLNGRSFADDVIPGSGPVQASDFPKLHLGWNIGLDDKIADLARTLPEPAHAGKDIDIGSRAYVKPDAWIHPLRDRAVDRIDAMAGRFRVLAPRERASQEQYYEELRRSRICVSPIGFGELCWRDFEAALSGCLLVKPDMGHLRTFPDIFVPGVTYAPVRWDYADLETVCARYLGDEAARRQIADNARAAVLRGLEAETTVRCMQSLLSAVGKLPVR